MTNLIKVWNASQGLVKYNENGNVVAPAETAETVMNIVLENALTDKLLVFMESSELDDSLAGNQVLTPKKVKKVYNLDNAEKPAEPAPVEVIPTIEEDVAASEAASEVQSSEEELHEEGQ